MPRKGATAAPVRREPYMTRARTAALKATAGAGDSKEPGSRQGSGGVRRTRASGRTPGAGVVSSSPPPPRPPSTKSSSFTSSPSLYSSFSTSSSSSSPSHSSRPQSRRRPRQECGDENEDPDAMDRTKKRLRQIGGVERSVRGGLRSSKAVIAPICSNPQAEASRCHIPQARVPKRPLAIEEQGSGSDCVLSKRTRTDGLFNPAEALPPEVMHLVMNHLRVTQVARCATVSKQWFDLVNTWPIWTWMCKLRSCRILLPEARNNRVAIWRYAHRYRHFRWVDRTGVRLLPRSGEQVQFRQKPKEMKGLGEVAAVVLE